ncbi:MAG: c-type cytochrome [Kangiellaceae bacterium]|nr:c-type cytochrome [Kangiellaceae bacterium]MCW8998406.1 c-type cytochrome [Kangiellaceae bacterium]
MANRYVFYTLCAAIMFFTPIELIAKKYEYDPLGPPRKLTKEQSRVAEANYEKYCTLCHGEDRQGHVNDHAPSLRSKSLFESGIPHAVLRPLSYGREGTPMGGYLDEVGGPLTLEETWNLTYWLFEKSGASRVKLSTKPVVGNIKNGEQIYQKECSACHGKNGEGVTGPALGNQSALAHNTDEVIRYAIRHGRQDTPMPAFENKLTSQQIDDVTAFLRSRASGWKMTKPVLRKIPTPDEYVVNPDGEHPEFDLSDGMYVYAKDLNAALEAKKKMVLLDTRVPSVWQTAHIQGSVPLPYYADLDETVKDLPKDIQIVAYCSCPRAAADHIVRQLRNRGFDNTAVLYEGIFGWMHQGYPVTRREIQE